MPAINENVGSGTRYLKVDCSCGRTLRAATGRMGLTVRCWDCRQAVPVPIPHHSVRVARLLSHGVREGLTGPSLAAIFVGALAFTLALLSPLPEQVIAALILAGVALAYGQVVRRCGPSGSLGEGGGPLGYRAYAARGAATLAVALVLTNAWEFGRVWLGYEPGLFREALAVALAVALVFPLAMMAVWAVPHPRQAWGTIRRHPISVFLTLMVVPLGLVAAEALTVFVTSHQGYFSYYVLDLLPHGEELSPQYGIPQAGNYGVILWPDDNHFALYRHHLAHGLSLSMALPSSLLNPSHVSGRPWSLEMTNRGYLLARAFHSLLVAAVWLTALSMQARCLGLLARHWDWQRPRVASDPVFPGPGERVVPDFEAVTS